MSRGQFVAVYPPMLHHIRRKASRMETEVTMNACVKAILKMKFVSA